MGKLAVHMYGWAKWSLFTSSCSLILFRNCHSQTEHSVYDTDILYYIIFIIWCKIFIQNNQLLYVTYIFHCQFCLHFSTSSLNHNFTIHISGESMQFLVWTLLTSSFSCIPFLHIARVRCEDLFSGDQGFGLTSITSASLPEMKSRDKTRESSISSRENGRFTWNEVLRTNSYTRIVDLLAI